MQHMHHNVSHYIARSLTHSNIVTHHRNFFYYFSTSSQLACIAATGLHSLTHSLTHTHYLTHILITHYLTYSLTISLTNVISFLIPYSLFFASLPHYLTTSLHHCLTRPPHSHTTYPVDIVILLLELLLLLWVC
jgi:hypothetical protein